MISFSGIDCSGKSTQINLLCKELEKNDIKYRVIWSRGGYTPGINFLKKIIRRNSCEMTNKEKINYSENVNKSSFKRKLLFTVGLIDLCFYYSVVLRMKEAFGTTIICDRYIPDEEVKNFFNLADMVVQPYRSATQCGVTQVAYHFEKPMLVTDVGGLREIVPDGQVGYVVEPQPVKIADAICDFYDNDRKEFFEDNVIEEKKKYEWSKMTATIKKLYAEISK